MRRLADPTLPFKEQPTYTLTQAVMLTRVHSKTFYRHLSEGRLTSQRLGARGWHRFACEELERWYCDELQLGELFPKE